MGLACFLVVVFFFLGGGGGVGGGEREGWVFCLFVLGLLFFSV